MQAPRVLKITVNMGVGEAKQDSKMLDAAAEQLATIVGQKPAVRRAKKSIAGFKLREGMPVGVVATLRRDRMWEMLDRLQSIAIPRIRDFRGLNPRSFDGRGNYTIGLREQIIFPEIDYDAIDQVRGLNVTITTSAETDDEARELLRLLGMPFRSGGPRPDRGRDATAAAGGRRRSGRRSSRRPRSSRRSAARRRKERRATRSHRGSAASRRRRGERIGDHGQDVTESPPAARKQVQDP